MATIKSYTDLQQSKKLAEFLPLESADMYWWSSGKRYYIESIDDDDYEEDKDIRAWLEKQGEHKASYTTIVETGDGGINALVTRELPTDDEQKPADKVESHFRVEKGKWYMCIKNNVGITQGNTYYGISDGYIIDDNGRKYNCNNWAVFQRYLRLWDITKDARNGDVLATKAGGIFIYKELLYDKPFAYCGVDKFGVFKDCNCGNGLDWTPYLSNVTPATKEQRDTLLKAMADAGYTFDFERKELKKIVQKPEENKGNIGGISPNSAWSEEDEKEMAAIEHHLNNCGASITSILWLKSIKDRVQPKQEWSEEDKKIINGLIDSLTRISLNTRTDSTSPNYTFYKEIDWLKSLRPQNKWKPSEDDIIILEKLIKGELEPKVFQATLQGVLEQLKKLKEE